MTYRMLRFNKVGDLREIGRLDLEGMAMTFAADEDDVRAALMKVRDDGYVHKKVSLSRAGIRADGIDPVAIGAPDFFSALERRCSAKMSS